jgi:hypothetical protein
MHDVRRLGIQRLKLIAERMIDFAHLCKVHYDNAERRLRALPQAVASLLNDCAIVSHGDQFQSEPDRSNGRSVEALTHQDANFTA